MRADYLTYQRATSECIRGLALQLVLTIAVVIYAALAGDHAAMTAAGYLGVGCIGWLCLCIVFDQHRRERIEAMEVDAMATSPVAGSSVFEKTDQFRPAAQRLAMLHRYFIPTASLVMAAILVGLGAWRFADGRGRVSPDNYTPVGQTFISMAGWALGLGLAMAALGFVFARYTATMAKQSAWANLRAGASFSVGAAVLGLSIAVAHFVDFVGPDIVVRYLQVAFPIFMIVMGVEIFVNFLLGVYRPRKAGETPRPAFDSRLLSFVAAPDRIAQSISEAINYQLGFDVTSGWFYKLLSKWLLPLTVFGILVVWGLSCLVVVQPHQRAMILRFGNPRSDDIGPGAHFKLPWPIETVYVPEYFSRDEKTGHLEVTDHTATGVRSLDLGTTAPGTKDAILWTNEHAGEEVFQFVHASAIEQNQGAQGGDLADLAMVSVEIPLQYAVKNVKLYDELARPEHRDDLLKATAKRVITQYMQQITLDEILGPRRTYVSQELRKRVQLAFDGLNPGTDGKARGAGVDVLFLGISGVHPPKNAAASFETPVSADERREAMIDGAEAEAIEKLSKVVGSVRLGRTIVSELDMLEQMKTDGAPAKTVTDQEVKIQALLESAGGSAAEELAKARAQRWATHMGSRGQASRYQGQLALYAANPSLYRAERYFESMKAAMKDARVYITSEDIPNLRLDVDLKDVYLGIDPFKPKE
jgi:regulator of protease activity HflC (stomatin/prohibitin superfamily)